MQNHPGRETPDSAFDFRCLLGTHIAPHESNPKGTGISGETFRRTQLACGWPSAHCLPCAPDFTTWISPLVLALFLTRAACLESRCSCQLPSKPNMASRS